MLAVTLFFVALIYHSCQAPVDHYPPEVIEYLQGLRNVCVKNIGIAEDLINNYDFGNKSPEVMCYMKCIMIEGKWSDESENIDIDKMIAHTHPAIKDQAVPMLEKCRDFPPGSQNCEKSYNFFVCLHEANPEFFYMP